ncbi:MAG: lycopene cyclase family protein [Candidatus Poseidoniaceae archaeon]
MKTHILGDGIAAMMLASRSGELPEHEMSIVSPKGAPMSKDHMLGFWNMNGLEMAVESSRASWSKWAIITNTGKSVMHSDKHAYHIMHKANYIQNCRDKATQEGVEFIEEKSMTTTESSQTFDSRPPRASENAMLQHFLGQEVEVDKPVFDSSTAILMDFRVDQSEGMHFIYLLPYSPTQALVESTLFSTTVLDREYYVNTINDYLADHYGASVHNIIHEEQGVIPMGTLSPHDENIPGLGANAGAIRPASGYTFVFIHQQIQRAIESSKQGKPLRFKRPHKAIDVWMDAVLLTVLRNWPQQGPKLFGRMASSLSGDEFVRFMSGQANWRLRLKVIMAMPKLPFIKGVSKHIFQRSEKVVA